MSTGGNLYLTQNWPYNYGMSWFHLSSRDTALGHQLSVYTHRWYAELHSTNITVMDHILLLYMAHDVGADVGDMLYLLVCKNVTIPCSSYGRVSFRGW